MFLYKIQVAQKLQLFEDYRKWKEFTSAFLRATNYETFLSHLIMPAEAHFHIGGYANKQNDRFCGTESPMIDHEQPTHAQSYC